MAADYIILAVIAFAAVSGGLFLFMQAKRYRLRQHRTGNSRKPSA
jgi:hypothetical protein